MKKTIRRNMRTKNLSITQDAREKCANEIFTAIEECEIFKSSSTIALFASLNDELPTLNTINRWSQSRRILLPRVGEDFIMEFYEYHPSKLESGSYGIFEPQGDMPLSTSEIDLIIVPGVAFTMYGKRLGRGKGYYDRYLSRKEMNGYTIGVGYSHQIVDDLPCEAHDVLMDLVVTTNPKE